MKTSRKGVELIKKFEGCRLMAYPDPGTGGEPWTIGFGHTSAAGDPQVKKGMKITQAEAEAILVRDLAKYEAGVLRALNFPPTQPQFDAMVSLCFNIGEGAFAKSSVAKNFNKNLIPAAADAFLLWNKAAGKVLPGLKARREAERALFLEVAEAAAPPPSPVPSAPVTPAAPETPPEAFPADLAPMKGADIAKWLMAAVGGLIAVFAAWMMKG